MKRLCLAFWTILVLVAPASNALASPADRDRDGMPDRWERKHGLSAERANANGDVDRDRVDNRNEYQEGTSPTTRDSDGDRRRDGAEDADGDGLPNAAEDSSGNDPDDRDSDDDGIGDADEKAGTVISLAGGRLTIALAGGGSLTAIVTEDTDVGCGGEQEAELMQRLEDWDGSHAMAASADDDEEWIEEADDRHDFEEACPASWLKPGVNVREASLEDQGGPAEFGEVEFLHGR